jgi:hypothetical protein
MPGFRVRIKDLPEQSGERRISVHWFFLPVGLICLAGAWLGWRDYFFKEGPSSSKYAGLVCAFLAGWVFLTFVMCEKRIRQGRLVRGLPTIRARQLILFGSLAGYVALVFAISRLLPDRMAWALPLIWVIGGGLIANGSGGTSPQGPDRGER